MKSTAMHYVPAEVYQELLEVERKYLLLVAFLHKSSGSLVNAQDLLDSIKREEESF